MVETFYNLPRDIAEQIVPKQPGEVSGQLLDAKATELSKLKRYVKKGRHKKRPFQSDILTTEEIAATVKAMEMEGGDATDAPFPGGKFYN